MATSDYCSKGAHEWCAYHREGRALKACNRCDCKCHSRVIRDLEIQPGDPICETTCPCCGAILTIEHGDDPGEIAVIGYIGVHRE